MPEALNVDRTWTDAYNAMPIEVRRITGRVYSQVQIQCLMMERNRLKRCIADIDAHVKNLREWCARNDDVESPTELEAAALHALSEAAVLLELANKPGEVGNG